jgi:hypothetical protein
LVALICGAAVTVIVHDVPASRVAKKRQAQAAAWKKDLAAVRARVAAIDLAVVRAHDSYNRLVLTSHRRDQHLLAAVRHWRRVAAQR